MCLLRHATLHVILGLGVKVPMSAWKLHEPHLNINMYSPTTAHQHFLPADLLCKLQTSRLYPA